MKTYKIKLMGGTEFTQTKKENEEFIDGTYKRAKIRTLNDGTQELYSYKTKVAILTKGGNFIRLWDGYSVTTMKHINEFRRMNGLETICKKNWEALEVKKENKGWQIRIEEYKTDGTIKRNTKFEIEQKNNAINKASNHSKMLLGWRHIQEWLNYVIENKIEDSMMLDDAMIIHERRR